MLSLRKSPIPIRQIDCILEVYKKATSMFPASDVRETLNTKFPEKNKPLTEKQIQTALDLCENNLSEEILERPTGEDEALGEVLRREAYENANKWRTAVKKLSEYREKCLAGNMDACKLCKDVMTHEEAWHFKLEKNIILAEERGDLQRLAVLRTRVYPELPL